jgi:pimeloyl-ACP methyl ester carboxylesterase
MRSVVAASLLGVGLLGGTASAQAPDPKVAHADYANDALWLCRPGLKDDKCTVDLTATVIPGNGKTSIEKFVAAKDPKIDCFFVYPTVSLDPGWQSDFVPDKMEIDDIKLQFARFGAACRQFAPMYRQTSLTALRVSSGGPKPTGERPPSTFGGYNDVVDAWNYYMQHDNKGRGVVLIGHSQGAGVIARLIAQEIDGKPAQKQFISGIVLGSAVMVPEGKDIGGTYKTIPLCRKDDQTGCVISYMSFRDTNPPPAASRFGKSRDGMLAACTNPANLASGKGAPESYFLTKGFLNGSGGATQPDWLTPHKDIATPFVKTPGLVSTACVHKGDFTYLEMHVNADPKDPRTDSVAGEVIRATGPDLAWGLHLIDFDHSMGDLVRIVNKQAAAWAKAH